MGGMSTALTSNPTCEGVTVEQRPPRFSPRRPPSRPALMDILWMVFHFIETVSLAGRLWEADVFGGESKPIILSQNGLWLLLSGPGCAHRRTNESFTHANVHCC